jgi:hypothetical protein
MLFRNLFSLMLNRFVITWSQPTTIEKATAG